MRYEKNCFAPSRRERVESAEPVHGMDRCRSDRAGSGRGPRGRGTARPGGILFRQGLYFLSEAGRQDAGLRARPHESGLDSGREDLAAERKALRHAAGTRQERDRRAVRRGAGARLAPQLRRGSRSDPRGRSAQSALRGPLPRGARPRVCREPSRSRIRSSGRCPIGSASCSPR